jgi:iron complex transport system substrate-binding protein
MRVVSLVPSWTETLLAAGVNIVGRTRFCVHPENQVASIPVVGGTKDLKLDELVALKPDLVILDQEENLTWMAEAHGWKTYCSHVEKADDLPGEIRGLSQILNNSILEKMAEAWEEELSHPLFPPVEAEAIPGVMEWLRRPEAEPEVILYIIWRGPWMAVARHTFIGSLLSHLGYGGRLPNFSEKYPKLDLSAFDSQKTLLLFSTEPYPFAKKKQELLALDFPAALVDGEAYSWFGKRSLTFLQGFRSGSASR